MAQSRRKGKPMQYDGFYVSLLGEAIGKEAARRYLRIKRIDLRLTPLVEGMLVLDVGCGRGIDAILLSREKCRPVCIDISLGMVFAAKRLVREVGEKEIDFILASAVNLPFADDTFDLCVSYSCIEHAEDGCHMKWLQEMSRVAVKNGYVVVTTSNSNNVIVRAISKMMKTLRVVRGYERFFNPRQFYDMLLTAGLHPLEYDAVGLYYHGYPILPVPRMNAVLEDIACGLEDRLPFLRAIFGRMGFLCRK